MNRISIFIALLSLVAIPSASLAQISVRSQLSHDEYTNPGGVYEGSILIRNDTNEFQQAKIYKSDYSFKSDGTNYFGTPGDLERSNADWIEIGTSTTMVPPNDAITVNYRVNVPASTPLEGSFWSIIMVEGVPKSSPESTNNEDEKESLGVIQVTRYGVQVATHIEGTGSVQLEISDTALTSTPENGTMLQMSVSNIGDRMVKPDVWVELYNEEGDAKGREEGVPHRLYPGTSVMQSIKLGNITPGTYRALVIMDAGDDEVFAAEFTLNIN